MIPGVVLFALGVVDLVVRVIPEWRIARLIRLMGSVKCRACGCDLRGSTGRCPECGLPFHARPWRERDATQPKDEVSSGPSI